MSDVADREARNARLSAHAAECDDCRHRPLPLDRVAAALDAGAVHVDTATLSRDSLLYVRADLRRRGQRAYWRRVAVHVLLASLPLPAILAYDAYVLRLLYGWVSTVLPAAMAAYLVLSYAALLVLLFALTYAAIPVLTAGADTRPRDAFT